MAARACKLTGAVCVGHCGDAALTRFVYCLALSRKVMGCASCAVFVFLNPRLFALLLY